ncbi:TetR/AcrR family transcriptional regulator [Pseudoxanthomonas winnipegensis]|nr:TetR/AcrR family transcriptional regulator [Pseudoxanthomonas winnipegensis]
MRIVRMPSQKSTQAIAPKRQRGRDRVATILEAATQLFIDQGAAVTMTEIAARSGTAIGSLYRFFPTRDALVATLLERYTEDLHRALTELEARAATLAPDALADALLGLALDRKAERTAALVLVEITGDEALRARLREDMRQGVADILRQAGTVPAAQASAAAEAVVLLIKAAGSLALQPGSPAALDELRQLLSHYLEQRNRSR